MEKPEEVIPTEETQQSVTDINTSEKKRIQTKKSILNKSDENDSNDNNKKEINRKNH